MSLHYHPHIGSVGSIGRGRQLCIDTTDDGNIKVRMILFRPNEDPEVHEMLFTEHKARQLSTLFGKAADAIQNGQFGYKE